MRSTDRIPGRVSWRLLASRLVLSPSRGWSRGCPILLQMFLERQFSVQLLLLFQTSVFPMRFPV